MDSKKESKKDKQEDGFPCVSIDSYSRCPESSWEMINSYGTYNIQPTADTENDFPAIAQGENRAMRNRSKHFFRGPDDKNPAAHDSDKDCID